MPTDLTDTDLALAVARACGFERAKQHGRGIVLDADPLAPESSRVLWPAANETDATFFMRHFCRHVKPHRWYGTATSFEGEESTVVTISEVGKPDVAGRAPTLARAICEAIVAAAEGEEKA